MAAVAPGDVLGASTPSLDAFTVTNTDTPGTDPAQLAHGPRLADPYALAFSVFDAHDENVAPVQVFPSTPGTTHAVDLDADKIGLGHFAAAWTVPSPAPVGRWQIRWFVTQEQGGPVRTWRRDFEVLPFLPDGFLDGGSFALVADVRDEGAGPEVKTRRIADALARASDDIRTWLGRDFLPRYKSLRIDGLRSATVPLDEPICAVESLVYDGDLSPVNAEEYRVYARHLSQGLLRPDDRDDPRIEFVKRSARGVLADVFPMFPLVGSWEDLRAPRITRAQELTVNGVFGYTDPDGSPVGVTPRQIRRATVLLALRELPRALDAPDDLFDARRGHAVKSQKTREQSIEWNPRIATDSAAPFSGDPDIDRILLSYVKPLSGGGV